MTRDNRDDEIRALAVSVAESIEHYESSDEETIDEYLAIVDTEATIASNGALKTASIITQTGGPHVEFDPYNQTVTAREPGASHTTHVNDCHGVTAGQYLIEATFDQMVIGL